MASISFVLPVKGGGGGAHSVVQEATAMRALGVDATILVNEKNFAGFRRTYARFDWIASDCKAFKVLKDCTYFAKTRWLRDIVDATHRRPVSVVVPSIDTGIYHPARRPPNR